MRQRKQAEPVGQAEARRRQRKVEVTKKIAEAQERKQAAEAALKEAKAMYVQLGPNNRHLLAAPEAEVEHAELVLEHQRAALALLDSPELDALITEWDALHQDETTNHGTQFMEDIAPEVEAAQKAANELVSAMVAMRDKYDATVQAAADASDVAKALADYGIRVRATRPMLVAVQKAVALALRTALLDAGLSLHDHWVKECLEPRHYTPPEKEQAA